MKILIVDGYNALNSDHELRQLMGVDKEAARDRLVGRLANFAASAGVEITVVFDGTTGGNTERVIDGVTVRFGNNRQSADHIIERRVRELRDAGIRDVAVATNDRLIGDVVAPMGAVVMSIARLAEDMESSREGESQPPRPQASPRLEDGLDDAVRRELEKLRRYGQEGS